MSVAVIVRAGRDYPPVLWRGGWTSWRIGQRHPLLVEFREITPRPAPSCCPLCWGQGTFLDPVKRPNGQRVGYVRVACPDCRGEGRL